MVSHTTQSRMRPQILGRVSSPKQKNKSKFKSLARSPARLYEQVQESGPRLSRFSSQSLGLSPTVRARMQEGQLRVFAVHVILIRTTALRTPEERLPSGATKEEFGRKIFERKSSLGDRTKKQLPPSAAAHGGEARRGNV